MTEKKCTVVNKLIIIEVNLFMLKETTKYLFCRINIMKKFTPNFQYGVEK